MGHLTPALEWLLAKTSLQPRTALSGLLSLDPERRKLQEQPQLLQLWDGQQSGARWQQGHMCQPHK